MGDQSQRLARGAGEAKKKLIAERDRVNAQLQRWNEINRRSSHPCDRSEVGKQVIMLRERRDALSAQIDETNNIIHGEE